MEEMVKICNGVVRKLSEKIFLQIDNSLPVGSIWVGLGLKCIFKHNLYKNTTIYFLLLSQA